MSVEAPSIHHEAPPLRVVNGAILVGNTRVPIDTVVCSFLEGMTPEAIAESYDALSLPEIYAAIAYYLRHRAEVDVYLHERQATSDAAQRQATRDPAYRERIERLLARGRAKGLRP